MSPHGHTGNRLASHPPCVRALGNRVHLISTKWHRHGRDQATIQAFGQAGHETPPIAEPMLSFSIILR
jgi:hypothetical protein